MKKITVEITFEETEFSRTYCLLDDIMDALVTFNQKNMAWSRIYSVSSEGLRLGLSDHCTYFEKTEKTEKTQELKKESTQS